MSTGSVSLPIVTHGPLAPPCAESELVESARRGDVAAFESLYRGHVDRVYALCRRMVSNPQLAEELTQETFLRAWQALGTFRAASALSTWLHRIAVNVVLGHLRTAARRPQTESTGDEVEWAPLAAAPGPDLELDLERAIATLPERSRLVLLLHDVEGYRHEEIAVMAGIAVGTSKAQLHHARRRLREVLT